jgi:ElaA protein
VTTEIRVLGFDELDPRTAYDVWRLRQDVFVVEQNCPYGDLDGRDVEPGTRHLVLWLDGAVAGSVRLLDEPDGTVRIGRVVLARHARGRGLADEMMRATLAEVGDRPAELHGQSPLAGWYASYGFEQTGPEFLDDGIPHVPMTRPVSAGRA